MICWIGSFRSFALGSKMKTIIVLPAYNAEKTLEKTIAEIPEEMTQEIILVDDASKDRTIEIARRLGLMIRVHPRNRGYGANQKSCYREALQNGAEIIVMLHPDYQYDPKAIPQLVEAIQKGEADAVFGSRMLDGKTIEQGMPRWKYCGNRFLTIVENRVLGLGLSEYHCGFRAYRASLLRQIPFERNSNGFVFDSQIIIQLALLKARFKEIPIKTRYFPEASTISFKDSILYTCAIFWALIRFCLFQRYGLFKEYHTTKTQKCHRDTE